MKDEPMTETEYPAATLLRAEVLLAKCRREQHLDVVFAESLVADIRELGGTVAGLESRLAQARHTIDAQARKLQSYEDTRQAVEAQRDELRAALAVAVELIDRLAESGPCYLTDDGFCMAHDGVAAPCPHPLGRQVVESWRAVEDEAAKR
jgi:hypothetical protein